jgi:hypothetical protein
MYDHACPGTDLHQLSGTSGMIQVNMRRYHIINILKCQPNAAERITYPGNGMFHTRIDNGYMTLVDQQVAGGKPLALVTGIYLDNVVIELYALCFHVLPKRCVTS